MKASTFFLGVATGSVAAAVTVLYSTPQSGNELRTSVKSASADMKEKFKDVKVKVDQFERIRIPSKKRSKRNCACRC